MKHLMSVALLLCSDDPLLNGGGASGVDPAIAALEGAGGADPLGLDFETNDVDTSFPVLVEGRYRARVKEAKVEPNKEKDANNLLLVFETLDDATSIQGKEKGEEKTVKAGFTLKRYFRLAPSKKNAQWDWKRDPMAVMDALLGTKQGTRPAFTAMIAQCTGKECVLGVKVRKPETDLDAPQNDIAKVDPPVSVNTIG